MSFKEGIRGQVVLLFGPPGAGKGTMGSMICAAGNHFHLSSGEIFRRLSPESEDGKTFHQYASRGELVPDELTIKIWTRFTQGLIDTNRYFPHQQLLMLDGVPRTVEQTQRISEYVDVRHVIVLRVHDPEVLVTRIRRRAQIEKRLDDADPEVIRNRINEYESKTVKVLGQYPNEIKKFYNAEQTPIEVLRDVLVGSSDVLKAMPQPMPRPRGVHLERMPVAEVEG